MYLINQFYGLSTRVVTLVSIREVANFSPPQEFIDFVLHDNIAHESMQTNIIAAFKSNCILGSPFFIAISPALDSISEMPEIYTLLSKV